MGTAVVGNKISTCWNNGNDDKVQRKLFDQIFLLIDSKPVKALLTCHLFLVEFEIVNFDLRANFL
jgi:hypothetical protein